MVRSADPFWNDVEDMNNGGMKCKFCGHLFAQNTAITRIRWHLSGVRGRGVKICEKVPEEVQDAARAAIDGPPKKRNKYEISNEEAISPGLLDRWMDSMIHDALENDPMLGGRSSPELCSPPVNNDIVTMNDVQNMVNVLDQSNAVHDAGRIPVGVQGTENGMGNTGEEGSIQHVDRSLSWETHS